MPILFLSVRLVIGALPILAFSQTKKQPSKNIPQSPASVSVSLSVSESTPVIDSDTDSDNDTPAQVSSGYTFLYTV